MISKEDDLPWEGKCIDAAYEFGLRCAGLAVQNPHEGIQPLDLLIGALMTELWDRNFSQSEIRSAFEKAVVSLPGYAIQERRSAMSTELVVSDWRGSAKDGIRE